MNMTLAEAIEFSMKVAVSIPERPIGCCRVYVVITDPDAAKAMPKIAKKGNYIFQKKAHYGMRNALYIGYDNCDGRSLARGTVVVNALKHIGIDCYREEHGD